jgi:hypothetical protein
MADASPLETALRVASALEAAQVDYAIGGALAYGVWGIPRATLHIDVNIFLEATALSPALEALAGLGVTLSPNQAERDASTNGLVVTRVGPYRLDLFTDSIPFCAEARRTRVRISLPGRDAWFLSAEALSVFKMLFFRPKDVVDLERLIAVQGDRLDVSYVRAQLVGMVGVEDPRVARWDRLVASDVSEPL